MAYGKSSRMDNRRASSYCSTTTIVVFVALCLVGVWMMTSSTVLPVEMSDTRSETNNRVAMSDSGSLENNSGEVTEDSTNSEGENNDDNISKDSDSESDQTIQLSLEKTQVENPSKVSDDDAKDEPEDTSKTGTFNDSNGSEGRETIKEGGDADQEAEAGDKADHHDKKTEEKSEEVENDQEQTKRAEKKLDQGEISEGEKTQNEQNEGPVDENDQERSRRAVDEMSDGEKTQDEKNEGPVDKSVQEQTKIVEEKLDQGQVSEGEKTSDENNEGPVDENDQEQTGRAEEKSDQVEISEGDRTQDGKNEGPVDENDQERTKRAEEKSDQGEISEGEKTQDEKNEGLVDEKLEQTEGKDTQQNFDGDKEKDQLNDMARNEVFPSGAQSELLNETNTQNGAWSTQAAESKNEKEVQALSTSKGQTIDYTWKLCNVTAGADYIPCLDNEAAIKKLHFTGHYEHRERHCPEEAPSCLVPLPNGYKQPISWPKSREKIWYSNIPHTQLAEYKGHQNWVKVSGEYINFPGGGTQFIHGALHYIDFIQESWPDIAWGKRSHVVLDVGCGVASFGGYLFDRDVLTMSFAPKDEHEAQVQFALERGIPAISAVMGTKRLPFPSKVFDVIHCARCRVPWHIEGGMLLLELNRLLRPGGYFVWSATPVYQSDPENIEIWKALTALRKSMCWKVLNKTGDKLNQVGLVIFRKPLDNKCYRKRAEENPPFCQESDNPDAAWNIPLQACMHKLPPDLASRGRLWPEQWPLRLEKVPNWINISQLGVYGKPAPEDFTADYEHWKHIVSRSYANGMGINWSTVRNVMDMRSVYGGFAAALKDMKVWVMNIVTIDSPDTLPVIYERGLFGIYHDWCESFSTYPRTYDLLHADHLFTKLKTRCKLLPVIVEVDRILRPEGKLIVRDNANTISEVEDIVKSLHWEIRLTYSKDNDGVLCAQKKMWRPEEFETITPSMP